MRIQFSIVGTTEHHDPVWADLDAIRERAREAARSDILWAGNTVIGTNEIADTASDVWQAEVERLRTESVPRSALVQVGWWDGHFIRLTVSSGEPAYNQPVYVIREDTDGR